MIQGHKNAVLQFSGGKDSLAALYFLKPCWNELTVMWCNTGDAFPETIRQVAKLAGTVKNVEIVTSDIEAQQRKYGSPADIVPVWDTAFGRQMDSSRTRRAQTPFACCSNNIWEPLHQAVKAGGYTLVIRGQRNAEAKKSTIRSGHREDGVEYWFPLEDWSDLDVLEFLAEQDVKLPLHYGYFNSSLDCMTCTAYLADNKGKERYLLERHPLAAERLEAKLALLDASVSEELSNIWQAREALRA